MSSLETLCSRIDPILYRTLVIEQEETIVALARTIEFGSKPLSFYETRVQSLYLLPYWSFRRDRSREVDIIVNTCTGVRCLVLLGVVYPRMHLFHKLQRLICPEEVLLPKSTHGNQTLTEGPYLRSLTHFALLPRNGEIQSWDFLKSLPITHLFIPADNMDIPSNLSLILKSLPTTIRTCVIAVEAQSLLTLSDKWLELCDERIVLSTAGENVETGSSLPPFVMRLDTGPSLFIEWGFLTLEENEQWRLAEEMVRSRQASVMKQDLTPCF